MNEPKQLECQLKCKATASCEKSVSEDLEMEDKPLSGLIGQDNERNKCCNNQQKST